MSSKSKSSLPESPTSKASVAPRVSRISRVPTRSEADSSSPLQKYRLSNDRSPSSINSKLAIDRRSPKITSPADKPAARPVKASDLQSQLLLVQEDLKKAKVKIVLIEKEKGKALDALKAKQKLAERANEKLMDALRAQKRAEESSEIEKFRVVEMEQAGLEATQKKEEEWKRDLEAVRNQHALDLAALLSTTQELQKAQLDLAMACDAKNRALIHADEAAKIAEIHAEKVKILSAELSRMKAALPDSKVEAEAEADENEKMVLQLREEADSLKEELGKAKAFEAKLLEKEASVEQLNIELEAARMAESYACSLAQEWKNRVEELEVQVAEANKLERSASESLHSIMRQLEHKNGLLQDAESETALLKEKVNLLEKMIERQKDDLQSLEHQLGLLREERSEMAEMVKLLKGELKTTEEEKLSALNNEKLAASRVESLSEEKNRLVNDLKSVEEEEEKNKKAMESLASDLREASAEARDTKEKLLHIQVEHETCEDQMENLRLVLEATNGKYETVLGEARHEVDLLTAATEQSKNEYENAKGEWQKKELHLVDCLTQLEARNSAMKREKDQLVNLLKKREDEAGSAREEESRLTHNLIKVEVDVICLQNSLGEAKAEAVNLRGCLLDKENEQRKLLQEKEGLQTKEAASKEKIKELSKLLDEAISRSQHVENGDLTDMEKESDLLQKVVVCSEENEHGGEDKHKMEVSLQEESTAVYNEDVQVDKLTKISSVNAKGEDRTNGKEADTVEAEHKMRRSSMVEKEAEKEPFEDGADSKADGGAAITRQQSQKKKKPLLQKLGSVLKGRASNTK
ncbi:hypothetical protein SAY87_004038 [Trapa incisa]|uniref:WEB family protein n=1 Tax=Trapa incisa TaxID=236973 RepID=A0AAN7PL47_9MYRT|nr:hypothetical protein SAY87_004038 [Trapa incisa]